MLSGCSDHLFKDNGRIYGAHVARVESPKTDADLIKLIEEARTSKTSLIAAGKRHSQGGQSFRQDGIVVDMTEFNHIIEINEKEKWILVQSGTSWEQIQDALNPLGLAVKVMQSSNIFTVGGSLSVNAHGRDPRFSALSSTVLALRVLTPDGKMHWIDRKTKPELFGLFIGGYGLFGFILEAKLSVTDNFVLYKSAHVLPPQHYLAFVQEKIIGHNDVNLHFARFNVGDDAPLSKLIAVTYRSRDNGEISSWPLTREKNIWTNKMLLGELRNSDQVKNISWKFQVKQESRPEIISRNNAMRPPILALDYHSAYNTDILQEYFIPAQHFLAFTHDIQRLLKRYELNLLNITVRYTKKNSDALLSYAPQDSFAFVFYVNVGLSESAQQETQRWTRELIDAALAHHGTFYLPYQRYATPEQLYAAYPNLAVFLKQKQALDPNMLFQSDFYVHMLNSKPSDKP